MFLIGIVGMFCWTHRRGIVGRTPMSPLGVSHCYIIENCGIFGALSVRHYMIHTAYAVLFWAEPLLAHFIY
jgi:hypothetical protein